MAATIKPSEARKRDPQFFSKNPENNWKLRVEAGIHGDGTTLYREYHGVDFDITSPFGKITSEVTVNKDGKPVFDKPAAHSPSNVLIVPWGEDEDRYVRIGIIHEARPHPNNPENPDSTEAVIFGQIPMGLIDTLANDRTETADEAAARETHEETGAEVILEVASPNCPWNCANPTWYATWSNVRFVKVDLNKIGVLRTEGAEVIYKAEFISIPELFRRIAVGKHEGAYYRGGTSLSTIMIFLAWLETNEYRQGHRHSTNFNFPV